MKYSDLKNLDKKALQEEFQKYKREGFNLRFQLVAGELSNTSRFKEVRKIIARIKTLLKIF